MNNILTSQLCPCDSGLRGSRCCSLGMDRAGEPASSRDLAPVVEQAVRAWRTGSKDEAARLCIEALELSPDLPDALATLYEIRSAEGKQAAARALIRRFVALRNDRLDAKSELVMLALQAGDLAEAEHHARNAVRIAPGNAQAHNLMGRVMMELQHSTVAEYHCRRALALAGRDPELLANLAWNIKDQGRMDEARALYEEAAAAAPHLPRTLLGWARLEEVDRNLDAAHVKLDRLEAVAPGWPGAKLARATVLRRQGRADEALTLLDSTASGAGAPDPMELLEKGRLLDQLGRYDDAWAVFERAKTQERQRTGNSYLADMAQALAGRLRQFFTANRLSSLPRASTRSDVPQPIFILGFPRSGTTLLEQMMSATPGICAGGELPLIHDIAQVLPRLLNSPWSYPEALTELWMGDQCEGLDTLRDHYLRKARQLGILREGATRFTDKMPLNEMHLGLIALIFPQAPLLHMIRHPLDVMVSVMSTGFAHGFFCGSALESTARHFVLVSDLVQHYRSQMPLRYLPVRYEDIVDDQEATARGVFDFIGEPFDPASLQFERNARYARTASYAQVTEKLYDRSRYRYRKYLEHLRPVIEILQPVIDRLGYTVEP